MSDRQFAVLQFINAEIAATGRPPKIATIQAHFGLKSPNGAGCLLKGLAKHGAIRLGGRGSRQAIQVTAP